MSFFTQTVEDISVEEFKSMMNEDNTVILDVRTEDEVKEGIIDGAMHINLFDSDFRDQLEELDKSKTYLVYCRSGNRSGKACEVMNNMGFDNAYNLEGGILAWNKVQQ